MSCFIVLILPVLQRQSVWFMLWLPVWPILPNHVRIHVGRAPSTSLSGWGLWMTEAPGSHRWRLLGGLFRFLSDSEGPPLSLESPFTSSFQRAREQGLSCGHTCTHSNAQLFQTNYGHWVCFGLHVVCKGEHLTHCCPLILTSTLPVTPAASPRSTHHIFLGKIVRWLESLSLTFLYVLSFKESFEFSLALTFSKCVFNSLFIPGTF